MNVMANADDLLFSDEEETAHEAVNTDCPWKVVLIDDEAEVHSVTKLALDGFTFNDRELEFISAHSGEEAKRVLAENPDTAVALVDVVMETDHAGLDVVKYVREELGNHTVRLVLRTGQPGQAPERSVITDYDINDYKEKTELTAQKLFTLMYSCLRSHRDIMAIEANKRGLEKVIDASANIFELQSMEKFTKGVLEQITSLMHFDKDAVYCQTSGLAATLNGESFEVVAGTGDYDNHVGADVRQVLDAQVLNDLDRARTEKRSVLDEDRYTGYFGCNGSEENFLHLGGVGTLSEIDRNLVDVFCRNVAVAFDNIYLKQDIEDTQREIVYRLGEAVETRSRETGNHVKRVAEYSKLLALGAGLDADEAEVVKLASPLHDVGKIGIPDAILNKPGKLTPDEWKVMKTHAALGCQMLENSKRPVLSAGAVIALEHHEKWNGQGYPHGKSGEDIHLYGRISAIADVFDALGSARCYKEAWDLERVFELLRAERGTHFDPTLIDVFFENLDAFLAIRKAYPDEG